MIKSFKFTFLASKELLILDFGTRTKTCIVKFNLFKFLIYLSKLHLLIFWSLCHSAYTNINCPPSPVNLAATRYELYIFFFSFGIVETKTYTYNNHVSVNCCKLITTKLHNKNTIQKKLLVTKAKIGLLKNQLIPNLETILTSHRYYNFRKIFIFSKKYSYFVKNKY